MQNASNLRQQNLEDRRLILQEVEMGLLTKEEARTRLEEIKRREEVVQQSLTAPGSMFEEIDDSAGEGSSDSD